MQLNISICDRYLVKQFQFAENYAIKFDMKDIS